MVRRATARTKKKRREKKIILVAAEGSNKTEQIYFNEFNREQSEYRIIKAAGNNTDPAKIVSDAIKSAEKHDLNYEQGDMVIAVFDTDFGKEKQLNEARQLAKKNNINVILSNPCFEVWFLQHFRFSTRSYRSNNEVVNDLLSRWPDYKKNVQSYSKLENNMNIAIENAKKLEGHHREVSRTSDIVKCNPSTDVYKIVELLTS